MKQEPFVIERSFSAPIERVWKAITDKDEMKHWYFDIPAFKAVVGQQFQFEGGKGDAVWVHLCEVTEVVPGRKLTHSWRYQGLPGISYVTFELFPEGNGTRLRLTHAGLESFPADNPHLARENFVGGWTHIINTSLENYLSK